MKFYRFTNSRYLSHSFLQMFSQKLAIFITIKTSRLTLSKDNQNSLASTSSISQSFSSHLPQTTLLSSCILKINQIFLSSNTKQSSSEDQAVGNFYMSKPRIVERSPALSCTPIHRARLGTFPRCALSTSALVRVP